MPSGEALMAKKVVGDVMIIQKNADAPAHPRPPRLDARRLRRAMAHSRL